MNSASFRFRIIRNRDFIIIIEGFPKMKIGDVILKY